MLTAGLALWVLVIIGLECVFVAAWCWLVGRRVTRDEDRE